MRDFQFHIGQLVQHKTAPIMARQKTTDCTKADPLPGVINCRVTEEYSTGSVLSYRVSFGGAADIDCYESEIEEFEEVGDE